MTIKDKIGSLTVEVGEPSLNHVRIYEDEAYPIEIHFANWQEIKSKIDRMFKAASTLSKEEE